MKVTLSCDDGHTSGLINVRLHECCDSDFDLVVEVRKV